jgi:hypothetical protein
MMNTLAQRVVLVGLARRLRENGSWTGEAHLQKAAYLLREVMKVPLAFDFIFYKHGPYSFGLHDELSDMCVDRLIDRETQAPQYGPCIVVTELGLATERRFQRIVICYGPHLDWIASRLGNRQIADLERLAVALWVARQGGLNTSMEDRATAINTLRPHLSLQAAVESARQADRLFAEAGQIAPAWA